MPSPALLNSLLSYNVARAKHRPGRQTLDEHRPSEERRTIDIQLALCSGGKEEKEAYLYERRRCAMEERKKGQTRLLARWGCGCELAYLRSYLISTLLPWRGESVS